MDAKKLFARKGYVNPTGFAKGRILSDFFFGFRVLEIKTDKELLISNDYEKYALGGMAISPSGNRVAIEVHRQTEVWDIDTRKLLTTVPASGTIAMDPNGTVLVMNHWTGKEGDDSFESGIWGAETGKQVRDLGKFLGAPPSSVGLGICSESGSTASAGWGA